MRLGGRGSQGEFHENEVLKQAGLPKQFSAAAKTIGRRMLTEDGLALALTLRDYAKDRSRIGPGIPWLLTTTGLERTALANAIAELEELGFIAVQRGLPTDPQGRPRSVRNIAGVIVKEALHEYLDDLPGSDD